MDYSSMTTNVSSEQGNGPYPDRIPPLEPGIYQSIIVTNYEHIKDGGKDYLVYTLKDILTDREGKVFLFFGDNPKVNSFNQSRAADIVKCCTSLETIKQFKSANDYKMAIIGPKIRLKLGGKQYVNKKAGGKISMGITFPGGHFCEAIQSGCAKLPVSQADSLLKVSPKDIYLLNNVPSKTASVKQSNSNVPGTDLPTDDEVPF